MTLPEIIDGMQPKLAMLAARIEKLSQENRDLKEKVEALNEKLELMEKSAARARLDADYLTVSHRLADSPDSLIATRRRISALIRNIDRCIAMLKDDPEI